MALREASGGSPVAHTRTMDEIVVVATLRQRFNMLLDTRTARHSREPHDGTAL
ncbi:MAG: hypothetical protein WA637_01540 [Terriglobales bacterium]